MGDKSKIEWCDATWNPVTGCTHVSDACDRCYASRQIRSGRTPAVHGSTDFGQVMFHLNRLNVPLRWKKPRRIFVCSMGDLFHEDVLFTWVSKIWDTFFNCGAVNGPYPQHTFMVLTKRPKRMLEFTQWMNDKAGRRADYRNLWLGVTAENQAAADERIPILLQTPAAKRFVSVEPMLGPVDLAPYLRPRWIDTGERAPWGQKLHETRLLDWVIVGGETGPGARPMHPDWPWSLRDQCQAAGVPFFFKGHGTCAMKKSDPRYMMLDGRDWREVPDALPPSGRR